jgi:hypothetical protein
MLRVFSRMYGASIKHQRRVICPWLTTLWRSVCLNQAAIRLGGGCFKATTYLCKVPPQGPGRCGRYFKPSAGAHGVDPAQKK